MCYCLPQSEWKDQVGRRAALVDRHPERVAEQASRHVVRSDPPTWWPPPPGGWPVVGGYLSRRRSQIGDDRVGLGAAGQAHHPSRETSLCHHSSNLASSSSPISSRWSCVSSETNRLGRARRGGVD